MQRGEGCVLECEGVWKVDKCKAVGVTSNGSKGENSDTMQMVCACVCVCMCVCVCVWMMMRR